MAIAINHIYNYGCVMIPDEDTMFSVTSLLPTETWITDTSTHSGENSDRWENLLSPILSWLFCFLVSLEMLLPVFLVSTSKEMLKDYHCSFLNICHETSKLKIKFSSILEASTKTKFQACLRSLLPVECLLGPIVSNFNALFYLVLKAISELFSIFIPVV